MVSAAPLWKYGARAERARRVGPFILARSAHLPVIIARPKSVTCSLTPVARHVTRKTGNTLSPSAGLLMPTSSGRMSVWLPTLGWEWQVVHVPFSVAFTLPWSASFTPRTPVMRIVLVLKMASPRAIDARRVLTVLPDSPAQEANMVIALGLK